MPSPVQLILTKRLGDAATLVSSVRRLSAALHAGYDGTLSTIGRVTNSSRYRFVTCDTCDVVRVAIASVKS